MLLMTYMLTGITILITWLKARKAMLSLLLWSLLRIPHLNNIYMMSGPKAPDFDTYGLFRAMHSHNPPNIRISWDFHPTFMLISGRVPRSFTHLRASSGGFRPFDHGIIYKAPAILYITNFFVDFHKI